jgi:hypothetical protein
MTAAGLACAACGTERREGDKFCHECGAPFAVTTKPAEYRQVTALFADVVLSERFSSLAVPVIDANIAKEKSRSGDLDGAVELARSVVDNVARPSVVWVVVATGVLVDALLQRGSDADLREAAAAIDRLAAAPADGGPGPHEIWLLRLRALLARAQVTTSRTSTSEIATERWRMISASRAISRWPTPWRKSCRSHRLLSQVCSNQRHRRW